LALAILGLAVTLIGPWLLYELALGNVVGRPSSPNTVPVPLVDAQGVWLKLRETGPIEIERLTPHGYALALVTNDRLPSGAHVAWFVARNHNVNNLKNRRMIWWHMSGAALTIWLTRHWSADQLIAKAHELFRTSGAASNLAFDSDSKLPPI
jgi:hypothetical protein